MGIPCPVWRHLPTAGGSETATVGLFSGRSSSSWMDHCQGDAATSTRASHLGGRRLAFPFRLPAEDDFANRNYPFGPIIAVEGVGEYWQEYRPIPLVISESFGKLGRSSQPVGRVASRRLLKGIVCTPVNGVFMGHARRSPFAGKHSSCEGPFCSQGPFPTLHSPPAKASNNGSTCRRLELWTIPPRRRPITPSP